MASESQEDGKTWVKFEEESDEPAPAEYRGAVINAETTEVNLEKAKVESTEALKSVPSAAPAVITPESVHVTIPRTKATSPEPQGKSTVKNPVNNIALRSVDLRDTANGRTGQTVTQVGNAVVRQGFGE